MGVSSAQGAAPRGSLAGQRRLPISRPHLDRNSRSAVVLLTGTDERAGMAETVSQSGTHRQSFGSSCRANLY